VAVASTRSGSVRLPHTAPDLRDKYLEWCSARVVERLAALTPAELEDLARRAEGAVDAGDGPAFSEEGLGRLLTGLSGHLGAVARREIELPYLDLGLPDFAAWEAQYQRDPAAVERELIGLRASRRGAEVEDPAA
jgi:hypothetical protein